MHLCACFNLGLNVTTHWTSSFRQRSLCLKLARRTEAFLMGACNYYSVSSSLQMLRRCVPSIAWEGGQKEAKQNVRALSAVLSVKCCWQSAFSVSRLLTVKRADSRWSTNTCSDSLVSFACWHNVFGILTPQSPHTSSHNSSFFWWLTPLSPIQMQGLQRHAVTTMTLSLGRNNRSLSGFQCLLRPRSLAPCPSAVLTERLGFQVQDVSISTFWWSPFIQELLPLWSGHSKAVKLVL